MSADFRLSGDEIERLLVRYAETGDTALRDRVVEGQLHIAQIVARKFSGRGAEFDDLFQVAALALTRAIERFDPQKGARFSTFATLAMVGEVKNYLRDRARLIRTPRREIENQRLVFSALEALEQELQRSPRIEEIARRTGLDETDVIQALELGGMRHFSLDAELAERELSLAETLGVQDAGFLRVEDNEGLRRAMGVLTPRQREVLHLRFFENLSQREAALRMGVSQMSISRAERAALMRLRVEMDAN